MLACAGALAVNISPPVLRASSWRPLTSNDGVSSVCGSSIGDITAITYTGTSIALAIAATCAVVWRLLRVDAVGQDHQRRPLRQLPAAPPVRGDHLRRFADRVIERRLAERRVHLLERPRRATAMSAVNSRTRSSRVSNEKIAASSFSRSAASRCLAACCASTVLLPDPHAAARVEQQPELDRAVRFGPEIENLLVLARLRDHEVTLRKVADEPPFWSRTTAFTETTETDDLNLGAADGGSCGRHRDRHQQTDSGREHAQPPTRHAPLLFQRTCHIHKSIENTGVT